MRFDEVLAKAVNEEISREEALFLLRESKTIERYLELFKVASYVRKVSEESGEVKIGSIISTQIRTLFKLDGCEDPIVS
jgi:hypothetical protein